jgi:hypothetical protein
MCTRESTRTCSRSCYLPWPRVPGAPSSIALHTDRQNPLSRAQNKSALQIGLCLAHRHKPMSRAHYKQHTQREAAIGRVSGRTPAARTHLPHARIHLHARAPAPPRKNTQRGTRPRQRSLTASRPCWSLGRLDAGTAPSGMPAGRGGCTVARARAELQSRAFVGTIAGTQTHRPGAGGGGRRSAPGPRATAALHHPRPPRPSHRCCPTWSSR